eukprot:TCALIF_11665-PA protein Name:"Similar to DMD Dystrophin (Gallus gallus)" AED:0.11 eAED:0.12 QI:11/0.44/0.31/0.89/0.88/0.89/19/143/3398
MMSGGGGGDQRDDITKKTFGKWLNSHLTDRPGARTVTDLYYDLRDGHILLDVLEVLTQRKIRHERGSLRVHKLSNVNTVLNVLKENQVKLVNIGNVDIVDGNPKITLALVWSVILHWQFDKVLGQDMKHVSNLESSLLAWCRQTVSEYKGYGVNISDFSTSWQDGLAFAALVHSSKSDLFDWEMVSKKSPQDRLDYVFQKIKDRLNIAQLLDPEDIIGTRPDKRSVMTYVMCLFHVLPHETIDLETLQDVSIESDPELQRSQECIGSPLKTPIKELTKGEPMTYNMFCQVHEDALEWLLDVEDKLKQLEPVSNHLTEARSQFLRDGSFMAEVHDQHGSIGEVLSEGSFLLERAVLTAFESKDVRIRQKLLSDRWEAFRGMALKRQNEQTEVVTRLQEIEVGEIRDWMTSTEDKISRMGLCGASIMLVEKQLHEQSELQKEFEVQEAKFSEFIDIVPSSSSSSSSLSPSSVAGAGNRQSGNLKGDDGSGDLEGQLMALGERWTVLCTWIEERWKFLTKVANTWKKVEKEQDILRAWLSRVEKSLRQMERSPTEDRLELEEQCRVITSIQDELIKDKVKRFNHLEALSDTLLDTFEKDNQEARQVIEAQMEDLQDRWDILTESMEAQKQRFSSLGFRLKKNPTDLLDKLPNAPSKTPSSVPDVVQVGGGEEDDKVPDEALTKRKITGTKRIEFESQYVRISSWLQKTAQTLSEHVNQESFPTEESLEEERIALYESILKDVSEGLPDAEEALRLGQELIQDIQAEEDFPPDYLSNVTDKVTSLQTDQEALNCDSDRLTNRCEYLKCKRKFYSDFETLKIKVRGFEHWLDQLNMDAICRDLDAIESTLEVCASKKSMLNSYDHIVHDMKELSNEVSLHPGALEDPSNRVKTDIYAFCDKWDKLENQISQKQSALVKHKRSIQKKVSGGSHAANLNENVTEEWLDKISSPVYLDRVVVMEEEMVQLRRDIHSLGEDANDEKTQEIRLQVEARIRSLDILVKSVEKFQEEVDSLTKWMDEVHEFLHAEDPAFGDLKTLDAQLKESNALQDDIQTLKPNIVGTNDSARTIIAKCAQGSEMAQEIRQQLESVNAKWEETVSASKIQNQKLSLCQRKSSELVESVQELNQLLEHLHKDLPNENAITQAGELSQRSYKLMQLKERIERKKSTFDHLKALGEECVKDFGLTDDQDNDLVKQFSEVIGKYEESSSQVQDRHAQLKSASLKYGEFKTLAAQESDWLERLEKKLRKPMNSAADAEEISEELDDIENFLNNHPEERMSNLEELSKCLGQQNILIPGVTNDAKKLKERWNELSLRAKSRTKQWEYKLIEVQEWLSDKDTLLTSHLEQELTVDDLPDESQQMLREFEDQENILSEMDEQVDTYREAGKQEAAARLEDQLHLIHQRFQELLMKFELFQQQPPVEYEPRLDRVHRQLRDIRQNIYLTDLASSEVEGIQGQLHHAKCIYNALSDIKPEVENVIKMGRKLVDSDAVENGPALTKKIDALKADFNEVGAQVTDAKRVLEKSLILAEQLHDVLNNVQSWLALSDNQLGALEKKKTVTFLQEKHKEMFKIKDQLKSIQKIQDDFFQMGNPKEEPQVLQDFRQAFQSASKWLESAEGKLIHPNQTEHLHSEVESWRPKIIALKKLAEQSLKVSAGQQEDVQPEMLKLCQRWEMVERKSEETAPLGRPPSTNGNRDSSRGNSISQSTHLSALHSAGTSSSEMDEEVIDTLPEDDDNFSSSTSSHLKRHLPADLNLSESKKALGELKEPSALLSSRESSPELKSHDDSIVVPVENPNLNNGIATKKEPPKTLPKPLMSPSKSPPKILPKPPTPEWFAEEKERFSQSPEKVLVVTKTIPSVQKADSPVRLALKSSNGNSHVHGSIPPEEPIVVEDEDELLAKETVAIEKILSETHAELAEVRRKASYSRFGATLSQENQSRETKEFEENVCAMLAKLDRAREKINQLDSEKDLRLRQDLIDMETKLIEAEVATLISRGDTLVLMIHRQDLEMADRLQAKVKSLRHSWLSLKQMAEKKASSAQASEASAQDLNVKLDALKKWFDEANSKLLRAQCLSMEFLNQIDQKRDSMNEVNNIANTLKSENALDAHQVALSVVNSQWEKLSSRARQYPLKSQEMASTESPGKSSNSSGTPGRNAAEEIVMRITKMREVVAAIDRQLKTQVLSSKQYESLPLQASALETVKEALEKLRPSIKKTAKDLDVLTGSLSVEYLERIVGQSEKLKTEWQGVNKKYGERHATFVASKENMASYELKLRELDGWLDHTERVLVQNESMEKMDRPCNPSDTSDLTRALELVKDTFEPSVITEKRMQMDKLCDSNNTLSSDMVQKLNLTFNQLVEQRLPQKRRELEDRFESLKDLISSVITSNMWTKQMLNKVEDAKKDLLHFKSSESAVPSKFRQSIKEKEPEILVIFQRFDMLVQETEEKGFVVEEDLAHRVTTLRNKWNQLAEAVVTQPNPESPTKKMVNGPSTNGNSSKSASGSGSSSGFPTGSNTAHGSSHKRKHSPNVVKTDIVQKTSKSVDATTRHRAPEIYAALRDHRDWIHRKRGELAALNLSGDVDELSRQSKEHSLFSQQIEERRPIIFDDITSGKELSREDIRELNEMEVNHNTWVNDAALHRRYNKDTETDLEHLQTISCEVKSLQDMLDSLREQTHRLPPLSPPLSLELERLQERLKQLQQEIQTDQKRVLNHGSSSSSSSRLPTATPMDECPASEMEKFNSVLPSGWERGLTDEKIPYFMDHNHEITHWDHPMFSDLMQSLGDINTVKYSAYRLSLKLRKIQQKLCLDLLELETAVLGFEEHGLTQDRHGMTIEVPEMTLVLTSIYETLHEEEPDEVNVALCVDLCLNWLLNVYDGARSGQVRVLALKIGILLMCRGPLTEKYLHLFKLVAQSKVVSPAQLGILLHDCIQIPKFLGEVAAFGGPDVEPSVRSCFSLHAKRESPNHVDAKQFLKWLRQEPESLVWLPVLHRLASAEGAKHSAKCGVCKRSPIVGFRYHCLKCFNFDLCHDCFFVGRTARGHKAEHPMQEYCTSTGASVNLKNFGTAFRNSFRTKKYFKKKQDKLGYLPVKSNRSTNGSEFQYQTSAETLDHNNSSLDSRGDLSSSLSSTLHPKLIEPNPQDSARTTQEILSTAHGKRPPVGQDDEHSVIVKLCDILHQVSDEAVEDGFSDHDDTTSETQNHSTSSVLTSPNSTLLRRLDEGENLETIIEELEEQNRVLHEEYENLRATLWAEKQRDAQVDQENNPIPPTDSLKSETKRLKRDNQRTEARMRILEEHNVQLEAQLSRLRRLVSSTGEMDCAEMSGNRFGTLQSKAVVATDLYSHEPVTSAESGIAKHQREPPPTRMATTDTVGEVHSKINNLVHQLQRDLTDDESLDLSDHDTQRVLD